MDITVRTYGRAIITVLIVIFLFLCIGLASDSSIFQDSSSNLNIDTKEASPYDMDPILEDDSLVQLSTAEDIVLIAKSSYQIYDFFLVNDAPFTEVEASQGEYYGLTSSGEKAYLKVLQILNEENEDLTSSIYSSLDRTLYFDAGGIYRLRMHVETEDGRESTCYLALAVEPNIHPCTNPTGHHFTEEVALSSCISHGYLIHTCEYCGYIYRDGYLPCSGHTWAEEYTVDLEATCLIAGSKSRHCTLCDARGYILSIDPLGHHYISTPIVEVTCTRDGEYSYTCDRCGNTYSGLVKKTGHKYGNPTQGIWVEIDRKIVSWSSYGFGFTRYNVESTFCCSVCNAYTKYGWFYQQAFGVPILQTLTTFNFQHCSRYYCTNPGCTNYIR